MIGIPDKVFFLLGNAIFENLVGILQSIPFSSIYAKISPPGMESAVFAYTGKQLYWSCGIFDRLQKVYSLTLFTSDTVGIANFCNMASNLLGSGVIKWSGMSTVGDDCNFDALPKLIIVYSIVIPTLVGIPATFLIPNILQTENMIDWEKEQWYDVSEHNDEEQRPTEDDEENNINAGNNREGIRHRTSSAQQVGDSRIEPHLL